MILFFAFSCIIGWLLGIWLPWYGILIASIALVVNEIRLDRCGLDGALVAISAFACSAIMVLVGFISGDVSFSQIGGFIAMLFTGS